MPSPLPSAVSTPPPDFSPEPLTIWCNMHFPPPAMAELEKGIADLGHRLVLASQLKSSNLVSAGADPLLAEADVALGQPEPQQVIDLPRLRWAHLTSAGYTRYDRPDLRAAMTRRGAILTNSSHVYDEPCAEHAMAMMLALSRRLPQCLADQRDSRSWRTAEHRMDSRLLVGQTALLLGFGAIGRRLAELLTPFRMNLVAVRRTPRGGEPIQALGIEQVDSLLPDADHVVNLLPGSPGTDRLMNADRFRRMRPGAAFYNIGRGSTVDQTALLAALESGRLSAAFLDVTDPEPLPPDHPLWTAPNCVITPHTAGGHRDEFERLARHFLDNLHRLTVGEPMRDRVV